MSKTKHTRGPWISPAHMNPLEISADDRNKYNRRIPICSVIKHPQRPGEAEANAKLIAAAPDLLEALEEIANQGAFDLVYDELREKVEEAIKKATK